jgi:hypothetical protein
LVFAISAKVAGLFGSGGKITPAALLGGAKAHWIDHCGEAPSAQLLVSLLLPLIQSLISLSAGIPVNFVICWRNWRCWSL